MWEWIAVVALLVAFIAVMPWAVSAMRDSQRKRGSGGSGWAFLEIQSFVAPSIKHLIEVQEDKVTEAADDSEPLHPEPGVVDVSRLSSSRS